MSYTILHELAGQNLDVEITRDKEFAIVHASAAGSFDIRHTGQLKKFVRARFTVRMFIEPDPPGPGLAPPRGHWETVERVLSVRLTIFTPDGAPFTSDQVTIADLLRFRDPRGIPHGLWSFTVEGQSESIEELPKELKVLDGEGEVSLGLIEVIGSKSGPPLVNEALQANTRKQYTFDLYRVGTFFATANPPGGRPTRELRLIDPDGVQVATAAGQLRFDVSLRTLNKSRDAHGQARPWTLEVLPSTAPGSSGADVISATVIGSTRIHVRALQDRIDQVLGAHGSNLELFAESPISQLIARLRIRSVLTAELVDRFGILDTVISRVPQEVGIDTDIRVGALYTLARKVINLPYRLDLTLANVKVSAIDITIGASEKIQPSIPALRIAVKIDGEARVSIAGIPLATVKVQNGQAQMEAGLVLDPGGVYVPRVWIDDSIVDVDVDWFTALTAGVLTGGLLLLGAAGAAELIEDEVNSEISSILNDVVAGSVGHLPRILAMALGDEFTHRALRLEGNDIVFEYDSPLEPEPKPDPNYVPIVGRSATQTGTSTWHFVPPTLGDTWAAKNLAKVQHIVVVMMENRSYDHVLGYRAALAGAPAQDGLTAGLMKFLGSKGFTLAALSGVERIPPNAIGLRTAFPREVSHSFEAVAKQLDQKLVMNGRSINSPQGFMESFGTGGGLNPEDVLGFYEAGDLPFSAFLADQYAYADHYFCSHPGPTLPNRMLFSAGDLQHDRTGIPILGNNDSDNFSLSRALTVFDVLTRFGVTWRVYESFPSVAMLRIFARYATDVTNIVDVSRFAADVATGRLPAVAVVEPAMHHFPQNDDHSSNDIPPVDMYRGQHFLKSIYDALRAKKEVWATTLLLITYDEHGGFYDHVVPLLAEARGRSGPGTAGGDLPSPSQAGVPDTVITPYGVRVPAFVVSPWVPPGRGPEIVLDHCSVLKSVLARFCPTRPFLSDRVESAHSFDAFLSAKAPRLQVPPPPVLEPLPGSDGSAPHIVTPPVSRKQMRTGNVDYHDLTGMLGRMLGR